MTIYLTNSVPNSFLLAWDSTRVKKLDAYNAFKQLTVENSYQDYDDNIVSRTFRKQVVCAIGHEVHAQRVSQIFTSFNGFYGFQPIKFEVPCNRQQIELKDGDIVIAAIIQTPGRLPEGKLWSSEELESFPIQFLLLYNGAKEDSDHAWRYEMTALC